MPCNSRCGRMARPVLAVLVFVLGGCAAVRADGNPRVPVDRADTTQYPDDDAVVLRHDRDWSQNAAGITRFEEHTWTQLLSRRAFRGLSDPAVAYRDGVESVEILAARAHLPDGSIVDVPSYGLNEISPRDVADWPAWAEWREQVVNFSGVQIGAVLELHYVRTTDPGAGRQLEADLRLVDEYPVLQSTVRVSLPQGSTLRYRLDNVPDADRLLETAETDGLKHWTWRFGELMACGDEPASVDWAQRCPRLRFTLCPDIETWIAGLIEPMNRAAQPNEAVRTFAIEHGQKELDTRSRVRQIAAALPKRFNLIESKRAWAAPGCRPAADVFESNYGSGPEAAALLTAALRSIGLNAFPAVAVDDDRFDPDVPTESAVTGFVVHVEDEDGPVFVDPQAGLIRPVSEWAGRSAWGIESGGGPTRVAFSEAAPHVENRIAIRADIKLDADGKASGVLKMHVEGLFFSPDAVRDETGRKQAVAKVLSGVLDGFEVTELESAEGSDAGFRSSAKIALKEPAPKVAGRFLLTLAQDPPHAGSIRLPLAHSERHTPVEIAAPFSEHQELVIAYPNEWRVSAVPISLPLVSGGWGAIEQLVNAENGEITLSRRVAFDSAQIDPEDFAFIRAALNELRSEGARRVLVGAVEN